MGTDFVRYAKLCLNITVNGLPCIQIDLYEDVYSVVMQDMNLGKVFSQTNVFIEGEGMRWLEKSLADLKLAKKYGSYVPESKAEDIMKQTA
eukprot:11507899-Karenia_brevis.AAC.1